MAGTAFYRGLTGSGGINNLMGSLASDQQERLGYRLASGAAKDQAEATKIQRELDAIAAETVQKNRGMDLNVAGTHGVDPTLVTQVRGGGSMPMAYDPKLSHMINRDIGAFMTGKPTDASSYHTANAELPGKQAQSTALVELLKKTAGDPEAFFRQKQGHAPAAPGAQMQMLEAFRDPAQRPLVEQFLRLSNPTQPGTTVMTPVQGIGPDGKAAWFYPDKGGNAMKPTGVQAVPTGDPVKAAIAARLNPQPAAPAAAPGAAGAPIVSKDGKWKLKPGANPDLKSSWVANEAAR